MRTGKFTTNVGDDDLEVEVTWEGYQDKGDRWTPPYSEMDILSVVRVDNGEVLKPSTKQIDRLTELAWDDYHGV